MKKIADKLGIGKNKEEKSSEGTASKRQSSVPQPSTASATTPAGTPATTSTTTPTTASKTTDSKMSQIPNTMKAACLNGVDKPLEIKEVPVPEVKPGEILIKVHACGVCHSDHHVHHGDMGPP